MEKELIEIAISPLEKWYYIATYVIASVAVLSLHLSVRSSRKVSEALTTVQRGLISLTDPLIKLVDHKWAMDSEVLSCESPPIGIFLYYKNMSNVPVLVENSDFKVWYGEKYLDDVVTKIEHQEDGTQILAPGEVLQSGTIQKELFNKYLSSPKSPMERPNIVVLLEINFSSLVTRESYKYTVKQEVFFSCAQPDFHGGRTIYENLEKNT
ncbi:hypothetical protein [Spongiibacter tropicus]|uniref:hypothetical protein n=1 Tax=Spongiibacter tropicus TaxID=454602 RepID=UPI0003B5602D|nr:hypothetical protein [Spongiibacter tropicus]